MSDYINNYIDKLTTLFNNHITQHTNDDIPSKKTSSLVILELLKIKKNEYLKSLKYTESEIYNIEKDLHRLINVVEPLVIYNTKTHYKLIEINKLNIYTRRINNEEKLNRWNCIIPDLYGINYIINIMDEFYYEEIPNIYSGRII